MVVHTLLLPPRVAAAVAHAGLPPPRPSSQPATAVLVVSPIHHSSVPPPLAQIPFHPCLSTQPLRPSRPLRRPRRRISHYSPSHTACDNILPALRPWPTTQRQHADRRRDHSHQLLPTASITLHRLHRLPPHLPPRRQMRSPARFGLQVGGVTTITAAQSCWRPTRSAC